MRKFKTALIGLGVGVAVGGCQTASTQWTRVKSKVSEHVACPVQPVRTVTIATVSDTPLKVDAAMEKRDWGRAVAYYPNGGEVAGSIGFSYETSPDQPHQWMFAVTDAPVFLCQSIVLPVTFWFPRPWLEQRYNGVAFESSSTVVPSLSDITPTDPTQK